MNFITTGSNNVIMGYLSRNNLGTTADGNVNIGVQCSGNGNATNCVAIGLQAVASVQGSVALGNLATASNLNSVAIGYNASVTHNNSVAIGTGASSTAINQIVLGSTNETTQIAGLLNVIKTATFTLPSFLSAPLLNYTSFAGTTRYTPGYTITVSPNTPVNNALTVINVQVVLQTITIPDIGSYFLETMIQANTISANAIFHIGFVLSPGTQELARQQSTSVGPSTGIMFYKN